MIHDNADEAAIARHAFADAPRLSKAVRRMVRDGVTSPEEAARIMRREDS
jgi:general secretion pathway protein E